MLWRLACLNIIQLAITIPILTVPIIRVAKAFTSGVTPSFILEKMTIGKVLAPAPEVKLAITKSSKDSVKAKSQPDNIEGVICVAYCNDVPQSVRELDLISQNAHLKEDFNTAVAYTVWSRKRGAGKEIMAKLKDYLTVNTNIRKVVTLSPLTPMATHFHIRNGAKLLKINDSSQNFEYKLKKTAKT